jgi:hypothetical protein
MYKTFDYGDESVIKSSPLASAIEALPFSSLAWLLIRLGQPLTYQPEDGITIGKND